MKHDEGVGGFYALAARQDHQRVDVEFGQVAVEVHREVRDAHQQA